MFLEMVVHIIRSSTVETTGTAVEGFVRQNEKKCDAGTIIYEYLAGTGAYQYSWYSSVWCLYHCPRLGGRSRAICSSGLTGTHGSSIPATQVHFLQDRRT